MWRSLSQSYHLLVEALSNYVTVVLLIADQNRIFRVFRYTGTNLIDENAIVGKRLIKFT